MDDNIIPLHPQTAEQVNAPQTGKVELSADQIRTTLVEQFNKFRPALEQYHEYALRAAALAQEYHAARFKEVFSQPVEAMTLVATLDARETPASLDNKIAHLKDLPVKLILFDRANAIYYLFV